MDYLKTLYSSVRALLVASVVTGVGTAQAQAQRSTPPTAQAPDRERELWDRARALQTPEAYQGYLDSYPFGRYAAEAFRELVTSTLGSGNIAPGAGPRDGFSQGTGSTTTRDLY